MKHLKKTTIVGFCALALSAATVHAASITIENPSFEDNWNGWIDEDPSAISGEAYEGDRSAKIEGQGAIVTQQISVENDTNYVLKAWIKGKGSIGAIVGTKTEAMDTETAVWEQITVEFNSGSNDVVTIFGRYSNGTGRFDAFTLESLN